jgi:hypothetical protein
MQPFRVGQQVFEQKSMGRLFAHLIKIFCPCIEYQVRGRHRTKAVGCAGAAAQTGKQRVFHLFVPLDPVLDNSAKQGQSAAGDP